MASERIAKIREEMEALQHIQRGLTTRCGHCGTVLESDGAEVSSRAICETGRATPLGWDIGCPACGLEVFVQNYGAEEKWRLLQQRLMVEGSWAALTSWAFM